MLVYNPDAPAQDQQIGDWFDFFVKKNNLKDEQCMVFAHRPAQEGGQGGSGGQKFRPRKYHRVGWLVGWLDFVVFLLCGSVPCQLLSAVRERVCVCVCTRVYVC